MSGGWACQRAGVHPEEWGMSWVVMGRLIVCHHLWGSLPGHGGGKEDAWLGSGHVRISGGHGWRNVEAVETAVRARQRWAGQQFFRCGAAHMCPPGHLRERT